MPKGQFTRKAILDWRNKFPEKSLYDWVAEQVANCFDDACWLWPFSQHRKRRDGLGYGYVSIGTPLAGRLPNGRRHVEVHRLAFFLRYGHWPLPMGRHTCNESQCFNPAHIIPGTNQDNVNDKIAAGRQPRGEQIWKATLTADKVRQMRDDRRAGLTYSEIAKKHAVPVSTIAGVVTGRNWKHVEGAVVARSSNKLSDEQVYAMRNEYTNTYHEIPRLAAKYAVSYHTAWAIINRRTRC